MSPSSSSSPLTAMLMLLTLALTGVRSMSVADAGEMERNSKFIFTLVKFPNVKCGSGIDSGTCVTNAECITKGGTAVGSCAKGYGVCCKVTLQGCGGTITQNNTLVLSTDYPSYYNEAKTCEYKVNFDDTAGSVCHIRYEHISNELVAPSKYGVCDNDKLVFKEDTKSSYFCGKAPDNYQWNVETASTSSPHTFTITTDTSSSNRRYAILVTWIPCSVRMPSKCGMYFEGTSGTITSYNFNNGYYLAGLSYGICFRKEQGRCTYTLRKTTNNQFIGGSTDVLRLPMGREINLENDPNFAFASVLCPTLKSSAMFRNPSICFYPTEMESDQTQGPFFINVYTAIDTVENRNTFVTDTRAGYQFDWNHNVCT
ncbi:uncharacterized protein LOC122265267 [Penaeus japonicus]|uniref:uncharacterized protein LOC122265267 n=1 Tax=Penaeus japonicus TaxID=27405 RepID=UPI001C710804|nr:uncharacterized protein LOC122265267 [Penaeus japonicus]